MARVDKQRHSGTTRKKATIDHQPLKPSDNLSNQPVQQHAAEPVAMGELTFRHKVKIHEAREQKIASPSIDSHFIDKNEQQKFSQNNKNYNLSDKNSMDTQKKISDNNKKKDQHYFDKKYINGLLTGVAGGVIALVLASALQYSGVMSLSHNNNQTIVAGETTNATFFANMQQEMAALKDEIATLKQQEQDQLQTLNDTTNPIDNNIIDETTKTAQNAQIIADQAQQSLNDLTQKITQFNNDLNGLKTDIATIKDETAQNNALPIRADDPLIQSLQDKTNNLDLSLNNINNRLEQRFTQFQSLVQENTSKIEHNNTALNTLADEIKNMPDSQSERNKAMSVLIAANALKSAVNRGDSYVNELALFQEIAPASISVDDLKAYANSGIASHATLVDYFSSVADAIVASDNQMDGNTNWVQKIWMHTKGLVSIRPVGNIEGNTPAAIAARMEVAIKQGDYTRALSEWQTLPAQAKAVSENFIKQLQARNHVDHLVEQLIDLTLKPDDQAAMGISADTHVPSRNQALDVSVQKNNPQPKEIQP